MGRCNRAAAAAACCYLFMLLCRSAFDEWQQGERERLPSLFPSALRRTWSPALSFQGIRNDTQVRTRPPESPEPRLRTSSDVVFLVRDPFFCSCTDGWCSFIHEGDSKFYLASHWQHVSDLHVGRAGGMERAARWKRSGRLSYRPERRSAPRACFLCSLAPPGPLGFLLCMSVISSKAELLLAHSWDLV